ncbi:hypothetical protein BKA61DRAFT_662751 [Leptodontidium sp. MPI-SDFR-AT-0119]|nr:hypothetical protein BKA61DRAFT_662751 [Leptodontidium sp. MPI-SDFR-AT-0119]
MAPAPGIPPKPTPTTDMEPIPLRSITVLINYERMTSDPLYKGLKLGGSTRGDRNLSEGIKKILPKIWGSEPESVMRRSVHMFDTDTETGTPSSTNPPATCSIHPYASVGVKGHSRADLDLIFHETRGQNGCYNATGMYQDFFALCPEGQQVSIQIANEDPVLIDATARMVFEYTLHAPKHDIRSIIQQTSSGSDFSSDDKLWYFSSGASDSENHCVLAFRHPENSDVFSKENYFIVDMTRLQYGEAGYGTYGETYFLGTYEDYPTSMAKICGELEFRGMTTATTGRADEPENQVRVQECAKRAWERWMNREKEGWCEYCGRGGAELKRCGACKGRKVWYCCDEHNRKGWKLHKLTCKSQVNKKPVFGPPRPGVL